MSQKSPEGDRKVRLAQALRENLKRRKSQARLRAAPAEAPAEVPAGEGKASTGAPTLSPRDRTPHN